MQIGTVTNQYINNYHNTAAVQTYNDQQVRQVQDMSETRLMEYHQEQYREQQRWLAYILMMQFFAKDALSGLVASSAPYIFRVAAVSVERSLTSGTLSCMRAASS